MGRYYIFTKKLLFFGEFLKFKIFIYIFVFFFFFGVLGQIKWLIAKGKKGVGGGWEGRVKGERHLI
jgi:hypothetical protein